MRILFVGPPLYGLLYLCCLWRKRFVLMAMKY